VVQRTSFNLDSDLLDDVKLALLEAKRLRVEAPRNLSAFVTEAIKSALALLQQRIQSARAAS